MRAEDKFETPRIGPCHRRDRLEDEEFEDEMEENEDEGKLEEDE